MTTSNEPTEDPVEVLSNIIKLLKEKNYSSHVIKCYEKRLKDELKRRESTQFSLSNLSQHADHCKGDRKVNDIVLCNSDAQSA